MMEVSNKVSVIIIIFFYSVRLNNRIHAISRAVRVQASTQLYFGLTAKHRQYTLLSSNIIVRMIAPCFPLPPLSRALRVSFRLLAVGDT